MVLPRDYLWPSLSHRYRCVSLTCLVRDLRYCLDDFETTLCISEQSLDYSLT